MDLQQQKTEVELGDEQKQEDVERIPADQWDDLIDYVLAEQIESYTCTLYRLVLRKHVQVCKWHDEVPDSHELGKMYGSGNYVLIAKFTKGKQLPLIKSYRFSLDKSYDQLRMGSSMPVASNPATLQPDMSQLMAMFGMMKEMFQVFLPSGNQGTGAFTPEMMTGIYQNVNRLLYRQSLENQKMITDMTRKLNEVGDQEIDETQQTEKNDDNGSDIIGKVIELIKQFLPVFLNTKGPAKTIMTNQARNTTVFQEVTKNPELLKAVIDGLKKEIGPENTKKVVEDLGIKKPGLPPVQKPVSKPIAKRVK